MARFPLQPLLDHSQYRLEGTERVLRNLKRLEDEARRRLDDLLGYRQEYRQRLAGASSVGMDIHLLRDYRAFLVNLEEAIRHQESEVAQAHARWQASHEQWLAERQKVKAYEVLSDRHHQRESRVQDKKDQRQSDESAMLKHAEQHGKQIS